ncbi:decorin-like [Branchiostoma floridae]|uniref:Decorin-like n=1 Tax=Branchiostoma floridae TaxID=7739 RepID=A0A9J7L793_BRAFL|nr:decorin-like [Branchiostoma floridae]
MSYMVQKLLVLLLVGPGWSWWRKETGPTTTCSSSGSSYCDRSDRGLSSVPHDLPKSITSLHLGRNAITSISSSDLSSIPSGAFSNLPSLYFLTLLGNGLSNIQTGAFSNLPKLERLYLNINNLTKIHPDSFSNLRKLRTLDLGSNQISNIDSDMLNNCPNKPYWLRTFYSVC